MTAAMSRETLHAALWASYVGPPPGVAPDAVLDTLARAANEPDRTPLVALALWNVLGNDVPDRPPSAVLVRLVRDVLGLDIDDARRQREGPRALPPFLELEVVDATCSPAEARADGTCRAVDLCVLAHRDDLARAARSGTWLRRCDVFWEDVHGASPVAGVLHLPGVPRLDVSIESDVRHGGLRTEIDLTIHGDRGPLATGRTVLEKERGRPGATRIHHERSFASAAPVPSDSRPAILAYWLQAEAICLAMQ
jgi:hypothetical protein